MRILLVTLFAVTLTGCGSSAPDATSKLIAERYSDCMPGLKAEDVKRISDRRYSVMTDRYAMAWTIGQRNADGEPFTVPAEDSMDEAERLGCM